MYIMYTSYIVYILTPMKIISITEGRKKLGEIVDIVKYQRRPIALGKHGKADVLIVAFPTEGDLPITAMNAASGSFDFLADEPDLYSRSDIKK